MNAIPLLDLLTFDETIEWRGLNREIGQWFTIADLNDKAHNSRCWVLFADLARKHYRRKDDGATLVQDHDDLYRFCWEQAQKQQQVMPS